MSRVFDCGLSLTLELPEFKLVFDPALAEKEFDRIFWKKNELILVHHTYTFSEKSWTKEEMTFNKEGGFTVQDTLDAICTSQKHFPDSVRLFKERPRIPYGLSYAEKKAIYDRRTRMRLRKLKKSQPGTTSPQADPSEEDETDLEQNSE